MHSLAARRPVPSDPLVYPLSPGRWFLWQAVRNLFPPHARAVQTDSGSIAISWSMDDDPHASQVTASPIMIRAPEDLFELFEVDPLHLPADIDDFCMEAVKKGLTGYDPYAGFPQLRVITLEGIPHIA